MDAGLPGAGVVGTLSTWPGLPWVQQEVRHQGDHRREVRWGLSDLNLTVPRMGDRDPRDSGSLCKAHGDTLPWPMDGNLTRKLIIVRYVAFLLEEHLLSICLPS